MRLVLTLLVFGALWVTSVVFTAGTIYFVVRVIRWAWTS